MRQKARAAVLAEMLAAARELVVLLERELKAERAPAPAEPEAEEQPEPEPEEPVQAPLREAQQVARAQQAAARVARATAAFQASCTRPAPT